MDAHNHFYITPNLTYTIFSAANSNPREITQQSSKGKFYSNGISNPAIIIQNADFHLRLTEYYCLLILSVLKLTVVQNQKHLIY